MSRPGIRWRVVGCGLAVVLGVAGCNTSPADGPSTTSPLTFGTASVVETSAGSDEAKADSPAAASPTPSVDNVPTPSSAATNSLDPTTQEATDRAAVEEAWRQFWIVYENIVPTP